MSNAHHRLHTLRDLNGLTQKEFASILGVGQAQYSQIEKGLRALTSAHRVSARMHFQLDSDYFDEPALTYTATSLNYRRQKLSVRQLNMATATFGLTEQAVRKPGQGNSLDVLATTPVASRRSLTTIERFAAEARSLIGLKPDAVINNVTRCLDKVGIIVTGLTNPLLPMEKIDGISTPTRSQAPFVAALNYDVPGDRLRFSAAHELGHILMHTIGHDGSLADREAEADMFASSFLLPREPMMDLLSPDLTLEAYARLKAKWGVSIQALVRRARDLDIIDYNRYRSLMIQISSRGWRKNEPVHIPVEIPLTRIPTLPTLPQTAKSESQQTMHDSKHSPPQVASVTHIFERG
ncbi:MAG: ImmA/IrrE family metallo-endopeptidase [Corynebacterium sp.]|uniref:XRE family transcriptional regulator n=1 Tax=Corynebacterium sp. TaxID=1720 RepID=UPI0026DF68F1|nr:ImmA/IrrE family metallo-endopeptidase [Corynebacterium sp.]MDO5670840.1 ImmA/IrrE family metallo-endopeptidase [Corynebacterium sp.]